MPPSQPQISRQRPKARPPEIATVVAVSSSSDSRAMSGAARACASARSTSHPVSNPGTSHASKCSAAGSGTTRNVSSVITPSRPSEPSTSSRSEGPAALAGTGSVASSPSGVTQRIAATSASNRPTPVEA